MNEEKKTIEEQTAQALISNTEEITEAAPAQEKEHESAKQEADDENKIFRRYKIKDIVFLAIMAACMLVTGAVMPLVGQIPLFGIIQVCLGLQFSVFPVIGMMKVRKPGALLFMSLCCGVVLVFMNAVMFVCMLICAVIAEGLVLLIFRGYKKDGACLFAGTIYFSATLPFLYIYYRFLYTWTGEEGQAVNAFIGSSAGMAVGMSIAVLAICFVGSFIGIIISRELKKSGVMKK